MPALGAAGLGQAPAALPLRSSPSGPRTGHDASSPQTPPPPRVSSAALHRLPRVAATLRRLGRQPPRRLCDAIGISTVNVDDQVYFHKIPDEVLENLVSLRAATVDPLFCSSIVAY